MAEDCTQSAPSNSVQAFNLLFAIENALREFIIESLSRFAGPKWYKTRLPGDVLKKYREGQQYERATPWIELVPHHPIYYVDFSDLRKIIEQNNNWADVFKDLYQRSQTLTHRVLPHVGVHASKCESNQRCA